MYNLSLAVPLLISKLSKINKTKELQVIASPVHVITISIKCNIQLVSTQVPDPNRTLIINIMSMTVDQFKPLSTNHGRQIWALKRGDIVKKWLKRTKN